MHHTVIELWIYRSLLLPVLGYLIGVSHCKGPRLRGKAKRTSSHADNASRGESVEASRHSRSFSPNAIEDGARAHCDNIYARDLYPLREKQKS